MWYNGKRKHKWINDMLNKNARFGSPKKRRRGKDGKARAKFESAVWVSDTVTVRDREARFRGYLYEDFEQVGQMYTSGTCSFRIFAQKRWIQVSHLEHSIIGRPAKGLRQKQVTRFHDSSSNNGGETYALTFVSNYTEASCLVIIIERRDSSW